MRTFVLGDIHGAHKAMLQCFERSGFDYEKDKLICLGDVVDGWPETPQCIEELLKIKNLVYIMGNHDCGCNSWFKMGERHLIWTEQGGQATIDAYVENGDLLVKHRNFFDQALVYYVDEQNRLFVHGGIWIEKALPYSNKYDGTPMQGSISDKNTSTFLMWDRTMFESVERVEDFKEAYIGHTTTTHWYRIDDNPGYYGWDIDAFEYDKDCSVPIITGDSGHVIRVDTGAGWEGKLTLMDIDTKEFWQSDFCHDLYPEASGRR